MSFTAEQMTLIKKAKAGKLKLNIINQDDVTCEKCDKFVPEKYYSGECGDEWWVECIHTGWYCPDHSPTSNCDDMECECCNPDEEEEVQKIEMDLQEISNSIKTNMNCNECDYSLTENEFDAGKGRIMFNEGDGIEKGQYRCGKCDIRADEMGYFPIEDEEEDEEDEDEEGKEWCEVGEHYVDADEMWEDFADCKNCVSEKEYKELMN
jgi:hypothetical protein